MLTRYSVMIFLAFVLVVVSGCSSGSSRGPVSNESAELTIHATMSGYTEEFMRTQFGTFVEKKFPNVTLKYLPTIVAAGAATTTKDYVAAGEIIDIHIENGSAPSLLNYGLQFDLTELIKKHKFDLNKLEPSTVEIQRQLANGGIYGIPYTTNTLTLFYNKDLFDKFGVPMPTNQSTWDDISEYIKRLSVTDGGVQYRGLTAAYWHLFLLNQMSVPGQDNQTYKSLYLTDAYKNEMEFITSFFKIPGNDWKEGLSVSNMVGSFVNGTSAMYAGLDNTWILYQFSEELNWDVVQFPKRKERPDVGPQPYPFYMFVTSMSKQPDIAFQVVASFASEEFQSSFVKQGYLPITKNGSSLMKDYSVNLPLFANKNKDILWSKMAPTIGVNPYQSLDTKYEQLIFSEVVLGLKDINTALRDAAEAFEKELAEQQAMK